MRRAIDRGLAGRRPLSSARRGGGLRARLGPTTQARGRSAESLTKRLQVVLFAPLPQNRQALFADSLWLLTELPVLGSHPLLGIGLDLS